MPNQNPPRKSAFGLAARASAATKERPPIEELKKVSEEQGFNGRSGSITTQPAENTTPRKGKAEKRSMFSLRLTTDTRNWITAVAYEQRISQSDLIAKITEFYRDHCGEKYDIDAILKKMSER